MGLILGLRRSPGEGNGNTPVFLPGKFHRQISLDAFVLWCCRRLLRVPWTAIRSNQSNLKEISSVPFSHSCVWLFVTPWTAACQASLSITNSRSLLKLMSIESMMPSNRLILSSSSPTLNLSQYQGLFQWVSSSHQVDKLLEFQLQHQSFQWIFRTDFF